jgi:hypothetical protein
MRSDFLALGSRFGDEIWDPLVWSWTNSREGKEGRRREGERKLCAGASLTWDGYGFMGLVEDSCLLKPGCASGPGDRVRGLTGGCRRREGPLRLVVGRDGLLREKRRSEG